MNFTNRDKASPAVLKRLSDAAFSVYAEYDPIDIYFKEGKYYLPSKKANTICAASSRPTR